MNYYGRFVPEHLRVSGNRVKKSFENNSAPQERKRECWARKRGSSPWMRFGSQAELGDYFGISGQQVASIMHKGRIRGKEIYNYQEVEIWVVEGKE